MTESAGLVILMCCLGIRKGGSDAKSTRYEGAADVGPPLRRSMRWFGHKVAVLADETQRGGDRLVVNAGVGAYLLAPGKLELIRLADGVGWIVESEPGESFGRPLWVDDDEVWVSVTPKGSAHENGILRLLRSSLGAPTVSRGF